MEYNEFLVKHKIMNFSIIVPVFNRPDEVDELLDSLSLQTYKNFEVVIIEDGSQVTCKQAVEKFSTLLNITYFEKPNSGPGTTRNYGAERASGDYFIFFDSDCIIPPQYMQVVHTTLSEHFVDCFGGPDDAHPSFTNWQKAVNYSMTSVLTTGGIRGKISPEKFHPRSFNMGYSRLVFERTGGYSTMRFGEDIDMTLRIKEEGFKTTLIKEAFVYHKRRTDFRKFYKQVFNSGVARINLFKRHPQSLKLVHLLPALFLAGSVILALASIFFPLLLLPLVAYGVALFVHSLASRNSFSVAVLSIPAAFIQLYGYGAGFWKAFIIRILLGKDEFHSFKKNFYK